VFALLFTIGTGQISAITSLSLEQFGYLMAITLSTGLVALVIYYYGLQRITASKAAVLGLVRPLAAVIIGWVFLSQGLTWTQALGAGLLLTATVIVARSNDRVDARSDV
jgi:probable blue pigment (indigoidine) exporter